MRLHASGRVGFAALILTMTAGLQLAAAGGAYADSTIGPMSGNGNFTYGDPTTVSNTCPSGSRATGFRVTGGSGGYATAIVLMCTDSSGTFLVGTDGPDTVSPLPCNTGDHVVGFYGRVGAIVDAVGVRCSSAAGPAYDGGISVATGGYPVGPFDCPSGTELNGVSYVIQPYEFSTAQIVRDVYGNCVSVPLQPVTITANDATRQYGAPNPAFGFTATGPLSTPPTCTTTATATSHPGAYPITCSGAVAAPGYYIAGYNAGTLTITKAATKLKKTTSGLLQVNPSAHLSRVDNNAPIAGKLIKFGNLCSAVTNANGDAKCSNLFISINVFAKLTATFAGDQDYLGSSASS